jgi:hypothetical protein
MGGADAPARRCLQFTQNAQTWSQFPFAECGLREQWCAGFPFVPSATY